MKNNVSKFDFVIVHGLWLYSSFAVNKVFKVQLGLKYFVMPHGMLDPYFQKASGRRIKALRNWLYWKLIEKNVVNQAKGLLFTCQEELQLARLTFNPYKPNKEIIVGLGVEGPPENQPQMDMAFRNSCKNLGNQPFLLFLSRIHEKKGVDLLIRAYQKIIKNKPNNMIMPGLVIAGPGLETNYGKKILHMVNDDETIKNTIFFPGMLSGDAKWGAFYNCDAFILPSHQENFGIAVVEALGCSKPVLISNKVNIWKEIHQAEAGIMNEDTLDGTIKYLYEWISMSIKEKEAMRDNAKSCFKAHYSVGSVVRRWKNEVLKS